MPTVPRLTERSSHLVEMVVRDRPDVAGYRFSAANTLDVAFAGATAMFTVAKGSTFRSPSVQRRGLGRTQYHNRGLTRVHYDPEDFWVPASTLPHDADGSYVRVEEQRPDGTFRPAGPVLIVPPPVFFTNTRPSLTVSGTAPNVADSATGVPPVGAMHFVLPRFADAATIRNTSGSPLMVSFNEGLPEILIPSNQSEFLPDGAISEVFVRGDGGAATFTMFFALVNAEMA